MSDWLLLMQVELADAYQDKGVEGIVYFMVTRKDERRGGLTTQPRSISKREKIAEGERRADRSSDVDACRPVCVRQLLARTRSAGMSAIPPLWEKERTCCRHRESVVHDPLAGDRSCGSFR